MAETLATKLGEITKKFKAVNKEVIAKLAEHGEIVKSSTSVITDEQAAMVVDLLTHSNTFTVEEIEGFKADAIKAAEKRIAEEKAKAEEEAKALEAIVTNLKEQGFKMGLISNWDDSCRNVLRDNGLETYLEPIIISSEIGIEKPDKRIFEKALAEAGVKAEECLYVGDNYYDDAVGAAKLGISSFIINPADYFGIEELRDKKVNIISDIREIPCKIREIQKTDKSIV